MNSVRRHWREGVLGLLLAVVLAACTVTGEGYVGGYYDPPGYDYGGWGPTYYVAPPRGGGRRAEPEHVRPQQPRHYRPAPPSRPAPSIPTRPHHGEH